MEYQQILSDRRGDVLVLTLNRPDRLNAWTPRMSKELTDAITTANDDAGIGAIVVTGAGRGFCAGADIGGEFAAQLDTRDATPPARAPARDERPPGSDWVALCRSSKPMIAAVNGPAIGVGLTMILPFDQIVAADTAKLSVRFVKMGLVPELASSHFLVTRCGWGSASWFALSGATVLGDEAARMGLVDRVVPADKVMDEAMAIAGEIAANPAPQVRMIKALLTANASETDLVAVQAREIAALEQAYRTPEHREAVTAFMEKRAPKFR